MTGPLDPGAATVGAICEILAGLLGRGEVAVDEDFRRLGGDSLRAVKAVGRIAVEFATPDETNERLLEALLDGADAIALARLVDDPAATAAADEPSPAEVLSYGEERLLLAQRYHPAAPAYHVVNAFRATGDVAVAALGQAVRALVLRHPALTTGYADRPAGAGGGGTGANPGSGGPDIVFREDIVPWPEAMRLAAGTAHAPFDLAAGRLLRVRSYRTAEAERLLLFVVHHIATDGWSMDLIYRDLTELYAGRPLPPAPASYRDFARWQRASPEPLTAADELAARLGEPPDRLELSSGGGRPPERSMRGAVLRSRLPAETASGMRALASETGMSLHALLLAVYYLCLARRTRQWDLLLGTVMAARTQPRYHQTVGFFANTLPVRVTASPDTPVADLLGALGGSLRWLLTHQNAPLEELAVRTRPGPDRTHGPLVDAVLVLQNNEGLRPRFPGCALTAVPLDTGTAKFDLMLEVTPAGDTGPLDLAWEYASDLLSEDDVADLANSFAEIAAALNRRGGTVRSLTAVTAAERRRISAAGGSRRGWPDADVSGVFERLADAGPERSAVLDDGAVLSRGELRELRERVAGSLAGHGVRAGDVVAVHLPRSAASVAALLAIWWMGAVPLFLDVHHPREHRGKLLRAARPAVVLTCEPGDWPAADAVLEWADAARAAPLGRPPVRRAPGDPAWLVATSGSTGAPKITVGTHRGLRNRCAWAWDSFPYGPAEVVALRTPLGFVDAIAETVVPLLAGVPLAVVPDRGVWDAHELATVLRRHQVTRLLGTPSLLRHLLDAVPGLASAASALRWCMSSGEPLGSELVGRLRQQLPGCRLINLYGSSEVAGDATWADVTDVPSGQQVPIGRPIANTDVSVVDRDGDLLPPGAVGELVVRGAPVGLGYLADGGPAVAGGFGEAADGEREYWTGDLGWIGHDGLLYFAGRRDRQLKVRGCRVELGQLEAAILQVPGVRQAAAWPERHPDGTDRICAAVVPRPGSKLSGAGLRTELRARLPGYMVPARIVVADVVPLSSNAKLDRAAVARLPGAGDAAMPEPPPMTPVQRYLRDVWMAVLDGEVPGLDEDFFALGGDSLAASSMLSALAHDRGVAVALGDFLSKPTIRALASHLAGGPVASVSARNPAG